MKKLLPALLISLLLSGCHNQYVHNRSGDYVNAQSIPDLTIPKDVPAEDFATYYPVPEQDETGNITPASTMPPGLEEAQATALSQKAADKAAIKATIKQNKIAAEEEELAQEDDAEQPEQDLAD
jgi:uncharacterized lipoprotein